MEIPVFFSRVRADAASCQPFIQLSANVDGKLTILAGAVADPVTRGRKNPLWMSLAQRLRRLRDDAGLALLDLTKTSGVSHTAIRFIEGGTSRPGIDTVEKLAAGLAVSPCWLAFGPEGGLPLRQKRPLNRQIADDPDREPHTGVFKARHRGCGERIRLVREKQGLTLRALAERADEVAWRRASPSNKPAVSFQVIYNIESGRNAPRVDTLEAIALALGVPPCWLAYGGDEALDHVRNLDQVPSSPLDEKSGAT